MPGGIIYGQILIPSPLKPRKISPSVRTNGSRWLALLRSARHSQALNAATSSGTGSRKKRFGKLNQRSATAVCASGVQMLMATITASSASSKPRAVTRILRWSAFSLFITSQLAPSSAYAMHSPRPQNRVNGVNQSNIPPLKLRPLTAKPLITAPTTIPWVKVARIEPPIKARSQNGRCDGVALKRNSKATPRKISPISIRVRGIASASIITA